MTEHDAGDTPAKNLGRRRLLQILTAGGGLAAAGLVPTTWVTPAADILATPASAGGPRPSPLPSLSPSVSVDVSTNPPPPTPSVQADAIRATPPFTG